MKINYQNELNSSELCKAAIISDWKFSATKYEKLLSAIYDKKIEIDNNIRANAYIKDSNIDKNIEGVKLSYTLRKVLNSKNK